MQEKQQIRIVLMEHLDLPREQQPEIIAAMPSRRQAKALSQSLIQLDNFTDDATINDVEQLADTILAQVSALVIGWNRQPIEFTSADDLDRIVTDSNLFDLAYQLRMKALTGTTIEAEAKAEAEAAKVIEADVHVEAPAAEATNQPLGYEPLPTPAVT